MEAPQQLRQQLRTKVYFRWACPGLELGEEVRVSGAAGPLGWWHPGAGAPLNRDELQDSCCTSNGVLLCSGEDIEYKYAICSKATGEVLRWEDREANRVVRPSGRQLVVEDDGSRFRDIPVVPNSDETASATGPATSEMGKFPTLPRLQSFEEKVKRNEEMQALSDSEIFYAVFRTLPVRLSKKKEGKWIVESDKDEISFKVVSLMARSIPAGVNIKFVGHPGVFVSDPEEQKEVAQLLATYNCIPVWIDEQVYANTIAFCNSFLWPIMHNMKAQNFEDADWQNYKTFNRQYAEVLKATIGNRSVVWIHDFYLMLVPVNVKPRRPDACIGFFFHCVFPMSEVMRCLPTREELLQSVLCCKVITFQFFEYARHFLTSCQLLLNSTYYFRGAGVLQIEHDSGGVVVRADHFVLPFKDLQQIVGRDRVAQQAKSIREPFGDKLVFGAIDGDEPFSGIILKLRAFQRFLQDCPQHVHRVGLLQHVLAARSVHNNNESELMKEVRKMADEINRDFGLPNQPAVIIEVGDLTADQRIAVLQAADALLDTSINDGLNIHPFLFYIAHTRDQKGAMIVSEFSGCSHVLMGARKVNPWNTQAVIDAMHSVVTMDEGERQRRFTQDHTYVSTQRLSDFIRCNLAEMKQVQARRETCPVKGLGAGSRLHFMARGFRHLSFEAVFYDYRRSKTRAILLDNEGTLAPDRRNVIRAYGAQELRRDGQAPDPEVLDCLRLLAQDRSNIVMVISGRDRKTMDKWFGDVEGLGLCAEHGFYWVPPGKIQKKAGTRSEDRWLCMKDSANDEDDDWKMIAKTLMEKYVKRIQGSLMEFKGSSVAWNYRKVGAQMLAKELAQELSRFLDPSNGPDSLMYGYPVVVVNGKGYVEVKRSDVNKGIAVGLVLKEMKKRCGPIEFILCVGDDRSDEDMFEKVNALAVQEGKGSVCMDMDDDDEIATDSGCLSPKTVKSCWSASGAKPMTRKGSLTLEEFNPADQLKSSQYYTVTVGRKPSQAGFFLKDVAEVSNLLQELSVRARVTTLSRFSSMPNIVAAVPVEESDESFI